MIRCRCRQLKQVQKPYPSLKKNANALSGRDRCVRVKVQKGLKRGLGCLAPKVLSLETIMCIRHIERLAPSEALGFCSIPLLSERDARVNQTAVFVVDVLCQNGACYFRKEHLWEAVANRRRRQNQFGSCGSFACLTPSRCRLVELAPASGTHKRRRYVLDEASV